MTSEMKTSSKLAVLAGCAVLLSLLFCSVMAYQTGYDHGITEMQRNRAADYADQYDSGYAMGYDTGVQTVTTVAVELESRIIEVIEEEPDDDI